MTRIVLFMGDDCSFDRVVAHYRAMSHREPAKRSFWNDRTRSVIAAWRRQQPVEQRRAA